MSITTDVAMLRVLALIANADGSVAPEEQQMLQRICGEDLQLERSDAWRDALTSAMDLKTAATSIPLEKRSLVLKLAYLVISACGTERGFPINPAELYAFNALVNHLELSEDQKELAVTAATHELRAGSGLWVRLQSHFSKHFGNNGNATERMP